MIVLTKKSILWGLTGDAKLTPAMNAFPEGLKAEFNNRKMDELMPVAPVLRECSWPATIRILRTAKLGLHEPKKWFNYGLYVLKTLVLEFEKEREIGLVLRMAVATLEKDGGWNGGKPETKEALKVYEAYGHGGMNQEAHKDFFRACSAILTDPLTAVEFAELVDPRCRSDATEEAVRMVENWESYQPSTIHNYDNGMVFGAELLARWNRHCN